jgi:methylenetetrahydrofolate reductase (NADPH)
LFFSTISHYTIIMKKNNKKKEIFSLENFVDGFPAPAVSFEFFPAKTPEGREKLQKTIKELEPLAPKFVSVTYGAGGSTRELTHETLKWILKETKLTPAAHLTCIGASRNEIDEIAEKYWEIGVKHIVALRGDPPQGIKNYTPHPEGYKYASELVDGLRKIGDFEISVAAFPEGHPESSSIDEDIYHLKAKVEAGANRAITQYFLDTSLYLKFLEKARKAGILLISNYEQFLKFSKVCGTNVPDWVKNLLNNLDDKPEARDCVAVNIAAEICRVLRQEGIDQFHFYTLNKSHQVQAICRILGVKG